jgi:AhpD family alkylhydroperoxidase
MFVPATLEAAPVLAHASFNAVSKGLGRVPNLLRAIAASPAALHGYLAVNRSLASAVLDAKTQARIALAVAEYNGCDYCLSAQTYLGRHLAALDEAELAANRHGTSKDLNAEAAVRLAAQIVRARGHITDAQVDAVRVAGYGDAEIVEIVLTIALNTFTNYLNEVAQTDIDFPLVSAHRQPL